MALSLEEGFLECLERGGEELCLVLRSPCLSDLLRLIMQMNATDHLVQILSSPQYTERNTYLKLHNKKFLILSELAVHLQKTLTSEQMAGPIEESVVKAFIDAWFVREGFKQ